MPETGRESCYNGHEPQLWTQHVQALNHLHVEIFPRVLEKGTDQNWRRVKLNYPELEGFSSDDLQPGYQALEFLATEIDKIITPATSRRRKA